MLQVSENHFEASWRRYAALNRFIADIAYSNLHFGFELLRANTLSEVLTLQGEYWQSLFKTLSGLKSLAPAAAFGTPAHRNDGVTGEPGQRERQQETASRHVTGTASTAQGKAERIEAKRPDRRAPPRQADTGDKAVRLVAKTKQLSAKSHKRNAATRASAVARKAEKIPSQRRAHQPPSRQAETGARKRTTRQDPESRGLRPEIRFGRLDDSAVRFTNQEAWRLQNGRWRRISVDKVLSEAVLLSKTRFDQLFPEAPQLPAGTFLPGSQ